jgi:class 3 adenylate cyclase
MRRREPRRRPLLYVVRVVARSVGPTCGAEVPVEARFCPERGSALEPLEPVHAGQERRLVTILFADVTSSTSLGERLDPERLQEVATRTP